MSKRIYISITPLCLWLRTILRSVILPGFLLAFPRRRMNVLLPPGGKLSDGDADIGR